MFHTAMLPHFYINNYLFGQYTIWCWKEQWHRYQNNRIPFKNKTHNYMQQLFSLHVKCSCNVISNIHCISAFYFLLCISMNDSGFSIVENICLKRYMNDPKFLWMKIINSLISNRLQMKKYLGQFSFSRQPQKRKLTIHCTKLYHKIIWCTSTSRYRCRKERTNMHSICKVPWLAYCFFVFFKYNCRFQVLGTCFSVIGCWRWRSFLGRTWIFLRLLVFQIGSWSLRASDLHIQ